MPIKGSDLLSARRSISVVVSFSLRGEIKSETLTFTHRQITSAFADRWGKKGNEGEKKEKATLIQQLIELDLSSPDIISDDDSGKSQVLNEEFLAQLDIGWLKAVMDAITGATFPNAKT